MWKEGAIGLSRIHDLHKNTYASETSQDHEDSVHQNSQINSDFFQLNSANIHCLPYEYFYGSKKKKNQLNSIYMFLWLPIITVSNWFWLLFLFSLLFNYIFNRSIAFFIEDNKNLYFTGLPFFASTALQRKNSLIYHFFLICFFPPGKNKW